MNRWLAGYEAAWRAPGTAGLAGLFTRDATYLQSPYEQPVAGLDAIRRMWEAEREGPDEVFTLVTAFPAFLPDRLHRDTRLDAAGIQQRDMRGDDAGGACGGIRRG